MRGYSSKVRPHIASQTVSKQLSATTIGSSQRRYWGLSTLLVATTTQREARNACPKLSRLVSCRQYTHKQPATRRRVDSSLNAPSSGLTQLKAPNAYSSRTGIPRKWLIQRTLAGTDSYSS